MRRRLAIFSCSLLLVAMSADAAGPVDECFERLPPGCFVTESRLLSRTQTVAIGKKLNSSLKQISNTYLRVQGTPIQVNILETETEAQAKKLHKTVSGMKDHPALCLLRGRRVIEFCKADVGTAIKTAYELGLSAKPRRIRYFVTARIATVDRANYTAFNRLFNVIAATNTRNPSRESLDEIRDLSSGFSFGTSVIMRKQMNRGRAGAYRFSPQPTKVENRAHDEVMYTFRQPPQVLGIPYVTVKADIVCADTGRTPTNREADGSLLSATPWWPVDDPQVEELARRITSGKKTQDARVRAILEWLAPGKNIRSAGPTGSRWGVTKVLKQKYGHCWDASDCFVALGRAAGIPCRQVAGWLYGTSGHVWAEVLVSGKYWQQVDPTGGGKLKCGIYHVPYFTTETGKMPILYVSMPRIDIRDTD